ncbi:MAG: hypothetical protein WAV00_00460 [Nocardioides sp.]
MSLQMETWQAVGESAAALAVFAARTRLGTSSCSSPTAAEADVAELDPGRPTSRKPANAQTAMNGWNSSSAGSRELGARIGVPGMPADHGSSCRATTRPP